MRWCMTTPQRTTVSFSAHVESRQHHLAQGLYLHTIIFARTYLATTLTMTRTRWFAPGPDLGSGLLAFVAGGTLSANTKVGTELREGQSLWYPGRYPGRVSLGQGAAALFGAEGYNRMPRGMVRLREGRSTDAGQDVIKGGGGSEGSGGGGQGGSGVPEGEQTEQRTEGKDDHKKKPPKYLPIKEIPNKQPNGQPNSAGV